jgi:outer membrane protein assembly factor BamB/serine/threonine protein kinase
MITQVIPIITHIDLSTKPLLRRAYMADRVGQQFGDYRLVKSLGAGGFADVYLGEHIYLGTKAAIKLLKGAFAQKDIDLFLAEAKTVVNLEHPHIVHVITFSVAEINAWRIPFLVMDYAPNGTLRQRHPSGTRLPLATIIPYVNQISDALQYAHDKKFIHRDIKPENMLLGRHDEILLSDFGIALTTPQTGTLETQEMAGTVAYMAPEQIKGHPRAASDQYSLAVIVYEWLCGERPFQGAPWEVINKHFYADPSSLREKVPTISPAVEQVVLKALSKEPQQRFPSVREFATALEQASEQAETLPAQRPVNQPIAPQPSAPPSYQVDGPANQPVSKLAPVAPSEQAASFPQAQRANPVNQAAPQSVPVPQAERAIPPTQIPKSGNQATPQSAAMPPTQVVRPANQPPAQPAPYASSQPNPQFSTPREPYQDTSLPANAYATIQAPSPEIPRDVSRPSSVTPTTERKRGPAVNRVALLVGLAVLVVVVGAGLLLIPLLTRGTPTTTTHPGTTATAATNPASFATSNGTMFGIDLQRTHFDANEHTLNPSNVAGLMPDWTATTGGIVDSSPTVANGIVYIGSDDGTLYAFKTPCGNTSCAPLWAAATPSHNKIRSTPAVANGIVYVGSYDHNLYAFNATTGKPVWTASTGDVIRSSPVVVNGIVYVGSNDHNLYAFNAATGKPIWKAATEGNIDFSSPAVANGIIYIGSEDTSLYAFDAATGKFLWMTPTNGIIGFSSPAVSNGTVYIGSSDHNLYAFNATTGKILWMAPTGNSVNSSPAVANGMVYVGSDDHHLYAYNASGCGNTTCNPVWNYPMGNVVRSSPTVANGVVYVGSDDGSMYALDARTGNKLWSFSTGNTTNIFSSPAVVNGVLYFGSTDHNLHAFHLNGATP